MAQFSSESSLVSCERSHAGQKHQSHVVDYSLQVQFLVYLVEGFLMRFKSAFSFLLFVVSISTVVFPQKDQVASDFTNRLRFQQVFSHSLSVVLRAS